MSALSSIYINLGEAKSRELCEKYYALWDVVQQGKRSKQIGGAVPEGIARDFVREFLSTRFKVKNGLIIDSASGKASPQIDAIIYEGVPLLEYSDVVIVEKRQVKGILEIKSWIAKNDIFGGTATKKSKVVVAGRDTDTGLITDYRTKKPFLLSIAPYILFTFSLSSDSPDTDVIHRLGQICDMHAIVSRSIPRKQRQLGKEDTTYNFDNSVSKLIKWLRNLR